MGRPNVPCFRINVPTVPRTTIATTTTIPPAIPDAGVIYIPTLKPDCDSSTSSAAVTLEIIQHPRDVSNVIVSDYAVFNVVARCNFPALLEYNWHIGSTINFSIGSSTLINSGNGDGTIYFGPISKSLHNSKFLRVVVIAHTQYGSISITSNGAKLMVQ
jgi:hypothetical protein